MLFQSICGAAAARELAEAVIINIAMLSMTAMSPLNVAASREIRITGALDLALRAITARTLADDDAPNWRRTSVARSARATVHLQPLRKPPRLPARIAVAAKRSACAADCGAKDDRYRRRYPFQFLA